MSVFIFGEYIKNKNKKTKQTNKKQNKNNNNNKNKQTRKKVKIIFSLVVISFQEEVFALHLSDKE